MYSCSQNSRHFWNRYNIVWRFPCEPSSGRTVLTRAVHSVRVLSVHTQSATGHAILSVYRILKTCPREILLRVQLRQLASFYVILVMHLDDRQWLSAIFFHTQEAPCIPVVCTHTTPLPLPLPHLCAGTFSCLRDIRKEPDMQCTTNKVISRRTCEPLLPWKRSQYYIHCVFAALVIQHAQRTRRIILSCVVCLAVPYFSTFSLSQTARFSENVFWLSLQLLSETFLILRRIQGDITLKTSLCIASFIFVRY
jgi:hypothetical protein